MKGYIAMPKKLAYLWDYDIDEDGLREILSGKGATGKLDRSWATVRLFEYAPYHEIVRLLGYRGIMERWPELRSRVRSQNRKRGFDFLIEWLKNKYPEKV